MENTGTSVDTAPQMEETQVGAKEQLDQLMQQQGIMPAAPITDDGAAPVNIQAEPPAQQAPEPQFEIPKEWLKKEFDIDDPAILKAEREEYRKLKEAPPTASSPKFENEQSENFYNAIIAGEIDKAVEMYDTNKRIEKILSSELNADTAAEIIKTKLRSDGLSKEEADFKFNKQFGVPKEPVRKDTELDDEFEERLSEWKEKVKELEMERNIEAKLLKPQLEKMKADLIFKKVEQQDEGYNQYLKALEDSKVTLAQTTEAYGKIMPKQLETKIKFVDEANKIDFEFQHEPDAESFKTTIDVVSDFDKLVEHFTKPDGTPDREGFAKAMYFALNYEKALTQAMTQSKNATIKSFLPDNSGGTQRQFPQSQEPNELDKMMAQAGIRRAS